MSTTTDEIVTLAAWNLFGYMVGTLTATRASGRGISIPAMSDKAVPTNLALAAAEAGHRAAF